MSAQKGDFISFSFNGVHSSELGIIRTSDGSRFNENLLPTIQDKTVQVPGGDGTYFFGSYYTQRQFPVSIAFDSLTEEGVKKLYQVFGDRQIHELIFDERPYKVYMAKINGTPNIKTICFEDNKKRIYKGEGTLNFICYYPFAKSRFKYLNQYTTTSIKEWDSNFNNKDEWDEASGLLSSNYGDSVDGKYPNKFRVNFDYPQYWESWKKAQSDMKPESINVYNPGDLDADFKLYFRFGRKSIDEKYQQGTANYMLDEFEVSSGAVGRLEISLQAIDSKDPLSVLKINPIKPKKGIDDKLDNFFCIDSKTNLIMGGRASYRIASNRKSYFADLPLEDPSLIKWSGNIYNEYITSGDFFKIPPNREKYYILGAGRIGIRGFECDYIYF